MRARVRRDGTWWIGEVYGTWENWFFGTYTGWNKVTGRCYTKIGAKIQLDIWASKQAEEFEL